MFVNYKSINNPNQTKKQCKIQNISYVEVVLRYDLCLFYYRQAFYKEEYFFLFRIIVDQPIHQQNVIAWQTM